MGGGESEVVNVTGGSQTAENKADLFITALLPLMCESREVVSVSRRQFTFADRERERERKHPLNL